MPCSPKSLHGIANKPPIHEAHTMAFVEQLSLPSLDTCEDE